MNLKNKPKWLYYVLIAPVVFIMLFSGVNYLLGTPMMVEGMAHLGYPRYFMYILGTAKLLGVFHVVFRFCKPATEWAFAGFTFILISAAISHLASGDGFGKAIVPIVVLVILMAAYFTNRCQHCSSEKA
jgi:hypothetical protein